MTRILGHRRTTHVKDWDPRFTALVTELYAAGSADMAAAAERCGHVAAMPRIIRIGDAARAVVAHCHRAARELRRPSR